MTLLAERDLTPQEREAVADEPRAGTVYGFDDPIPQHATDVLIAYELSQKLGKDERAELIDLVGKAHPVNFGRDSRREQRGGIHSEPLVRLLAFRAWGDRDRKWFEPIEVAKREYGFDEIVMEYDAFNRTTTYRVRKGGAVAEVATNDALDASPMREAFRRKLLDGLATKVGLRPRH